MAEIQYARIVHKSADGPPTIPPSASHDNGDWTINDIYENELYVDRLTGFLYSRHGSDIVLLAPLPTVIEVKGTSTQTTSSGTYVLLDSITSTPAEGTYLVIFSGMCEAPLLEKLYVELFVDGVAVATSQRFNTNLNATANLDRRGFSFQEKITVDGTQDVEVRWKTSSGSGKFYERNMSLMKCSPL